MSLKYDITEINSIHDIKKQIAEAKEEIEKEYAKLDNEMDYVEREISKLNSEKDELLEKIEEDYEAKIDKLEQKKSEIMIAYKHKNEKLAGVKAKIEAKAGAKTEVEIAELAEYEELQRKYIDAYNREDLVQVVILFNEIYGYVEDERDIPYLSLFMYKQLSSYFDRQYKYVVKLINEAIDTLCDIYFVKKEKEITPLILCSIANLCYCIDDRIYEANVYIEEAFEMDSDSFIINFFMFMKEFGYTDGKIEDYVDYIISECNNMDVLYLFFNKYRNCVVENKDKDKDEYIYEMLLERNKHFKQKHYSIIHCELKHQNSDLFEKIEKDKYWTKHKILNLKYIPLSIKSMYCHFFDINPILDEAIDCKNAIYINFVTFNKMNTLRGKALELYKKAEELGCNYAVNNIGLYYHNNKDYRIAYRYFHRAYENNYMFGLYNCFYMNIELREHIDDDIALNEDEMDELAIRLQDTSNCVHLKASADRIIKRGKYINRAKGLFLRAYELGDVDAYLRLATNYYLGENINMNNIEEATSIIETVEKKHPDEDTRFERQCLDIAIRRTYGKPNI